MNLLIISNIPTPYRCYFFSFLSSLLESKGGRLLVLFTAKNENNRDWNPDTFKFDFNYEFLPSITLSLFETHFHFNVFFKKKILMFKPTHTILAGSWNSPINMYMLVFSKNSLGKILFWSESHIYSTRYKFILIKLLRKYFFNKIDFFLVPNTLSQNFVILNSSKPKTFIYLPNTVDQNIFNESNSINSFIDNFGIDFIGKINVIQVSQLEKRKGVIELINNFLDLPKDFQDNFNLIIVGNGPLKNTVNDLISNNKNIYIFEYLPQSKIAELYKKCDYFILSSFKDPNPLSPIEAVFANKIIFISQYLGNSNELMPDELKEKLFFDPNLDFRKIFYTMFDLNRNKLEFLNVQKTLHINVQRKWDINKVCNQLISDISNI
jgi:glycosyltransferase involved in cell wall biosynthesis